MLIDYAWASKTGGSQLLDLSRDALFGVGWMPIALVFFAFTAHSIAALLIASWRRTRTR